MRLLALCLMNGSLVFGWQDPAPTPSVRQLPAFIQKKVDHAKTGDVFAMLQANDWETRCARVPSFSKDIIRPKLEAMVKDGNTEAMLALATELHSDNPSGPEPQRSRELVKQAALLGSGEGMVEYAASIWRNEKNQEDAVKWFLLGKEALERRANQGELNAILGLAYLFPFSEDKRIRNQEAYEKRMGWLRKAAEREHPDAMYSLGSVLYNRHDPEARIWMEKAANAGSWEAMVEMGRYYAEGFPGVPVERSETSSGHRAAKLSPLKPGDPPPASTRLNPAKAWEWWDKAIALVGEEKVMSLLPEELPERPKRP